jgi:dTDP-4-dehydrorhamnose 3,5-epimerase
MDFIKTEISDLFLIEPEPYYDNRGKFYRVFCQKKFQNINMGKKRIVQINQSFNKIKGTIRGMHYQHPPKAETKIVKCIKGKIFDVVIDLRENSPTFLKSYSIILSMENMKMIYIPEGFAHGFQTLSNNSEVLYLHTEFYNPEFEDGLRYDDPKLSIDWPLEVTEISARDKKHPLIHGGFKGIIIT